MQSQHNRILSKTVKWILSALPFFLYIWTPTCLCAIQRFHRAACAGTVQIWKGLGFPNKHFATQNSRCIYVCPACYNCVSSERFTASELYRCPNLSYNEDVLRERCAVCRLYILQFSPAQNASYFWLHTPSHLSANAFKSPIWFIRCHGIVELARIFYFASLYTTHGLRGWVTWTTSP